MQRGVSCLLLLTTALFATSTATENPNVRVMYTVKEFGKPAVTESFSTEESVLDDTNFNTLRKEREKLLEHATQTFAEDDEIMAHTEKMLDDLQSSTSLLTDEFMGGDKLFEEFFPGALGHHRRTAGGLFSSFMHGMESAFDFGLRHGKHQSRRPWNSKDHAHKSPKTCCCKDIHKFCSNVKTDGSPVGYYKVMKCLADRQRFHGDIHPLCVHRLEKTVAGNCAETIDKKCANVIPGNNALHKCLIQHVNDADTPAQCQAYLDLADIKEKKPNKYTRAKTAVSGEATGGATGVEGFRATTATVLKKKSVPAIPAQKAKITPKTKLVAAALSSGIAKPVPSAAGVETHHALKPVYLVAGIAIFVVAIVGSAFAIKKQRRQARELAMNRMANDPNLYKAIE